MRWPFARGGFRGAHQEGAGVDLGPSAIKGVRLTRRLGAVTLTGVAVEPCEKGWYDPAGVRNSQALARTLATLCEKLKVDRIVMALPDSAVIQRAVDLPRGLSESEEEEMVLAELARMTPIPVEELRVDWRRYGPGSIPENERTMIVAARQERVEALQLLAEEAGVTLIHLDVASLALRRAAVRAGLLDGVVALVDLGEEAIELAVWENGEKRFERAQPFEAARLRRELARHLQSSSAAETLLAEGNWDETLKREVLQPFLAKMSIEIANLLKFYFHAVEGALPLNRILLAGGGAVLPGVVAAVQSMVTPPVALLQPWQGVKGVGAWQAQAPRFALATGLAWRVVG